MIETIAKRGALWSAKGWCFSRLWENCRTQTMYTDKLLEDALLKKVVWTLCNEGDTSLLCGSGHEGASLSEWTLGTCSNPDSKGGHHVGRWCRSHTETPAQPSRDCPESSSESTEQLPVPGCQTPRTHRSLEPTWLTVTLLLTVTAEGGRLPAQTPVNWKSELFKEKQIQRRDTRPIHWLTSFRWNGHKNIKLYYGDSYQERVLQLKQGHKINLFYLPPL